MRSFRDQRLTNDYEELLRLEQQLNQGGKIKLEIQPTGSRPHQSYNLIFHCRGYADEFGTARLRHHLFLEFPKAYPIETPPTFKRVSPLFHPNIYPHGVFCLGFEGERKWRPGISLESLVMHVSRLIRFDPDWINLNPPANRTHAFWTEFLQKIKLPADDDPFVPAEELTGPPTRRAEVIERPAPTPPARRPIRIAPARERGGPSIVRPRRSGPVGPIRIRRSDPGG